MLKLTRQEIIEKLIDDDIDIIYSKQATDYIDSILRMGFKGYQTYTNEELKQDFEERVDQTNEGVYIV